MGRFSPDKSALESGIAGSGVFEYDIDNPSTRLLEIMFACGVEETVIERLKRRCDDIATDLRDLKG